MGKGRTNQYRASAKKFAFKFEGNGPAQGQVGKYYPADDVVIKKGPAPVRNAPKLRTALKPGTVVIILAGRFRGKRAIFLKALSSGLCLVSGPYAVNGVPLRRVNQKYLIATSTSVNLAGVDVSKIDDAFFSREGESKTKPEDSFNPSLPRETKTSADRKAAQTKVDAAIGANLKKTDMLEAYLGAKFSLSRGDCPHLMKF
jgi:large subunit ribosomal protein L6e